MSAGYFHDLASIYSDYIFSEVGDAPYPFSTDGWSDTSSGGASGASQFREYVAEFVTAAGEHYTVEVSWWAGVHREISIEFHRAGIGNPYDVSVSNTGDAFKVFSTVTKIVHGAIDQLDATPARIVFSADKSQAQGGSRVRLYARLANQLARRYKMSVDTLDKSSKVVYRLIADSPSGGDH